jgi:DNA end-binding protein Ku
MVQHAYWTGHIRLSLVTFPVRLYNAVTETRRIRLHKYDRESQQRIHYQNVNEEGEVVEPRDIVKGYEYEKGSFVPIEDKELDKLRIESKHTIELVQFCPRPSIDPIYYDSPYFIAPDGEIALEAYLTLREALRGSDKIALGQVVLSNRERIAAIKPCGKGMIMETLRYNYEVREAEDYFSDIKNLPLNKEQLALAEQLIESKSADFDPRQFKDRYQSGLQEIINAKLEHRKPDYGKEPAAGGKVISIMDALRKSLAQSGRKTTAPEKTAKPRKSSSSAKHKRKPAVRKRA